MLLLLTLGEESLTLEGEILTLGDEILTLVLPRSYLKYS
jgi:hypothetical protein